jgi:hypothetical protein
MSYTNKMRTPSPIEKIIAIGSYIFPMVGFVIIIIVALMKKDMKPFLKYHIFQSIFIAFGLSIIAYGLTLLMNMLSAIPVVKNVISFVTFYLNTPIVLGFSVITTIYFIVIMYLIIGVIRNSDSYIPWVSDIIKANLRGQI